MLYAPTRFDALIGEPWVPARVEDAIAAIVADADTAFDATALLPAHEWDAEAGPAVAHLAPLLLGAAHSATDSGPAAVWCFDVITRSSGSTPS
jgi:hypothetical protein